MIRWLHISDLHAGGEGAALRNELFDELAVELPAMSARIGAPDLILFTGDLTFSGERAQYEEVNGILGRIRGWLREAHPHMAEPLMVAVPGNHDLVRPSPRERRNYRILLEYDKGDDADVKELRKELWEDRNPSILADMFQHYASWQAGCVLEPLERARLRGDRCQLVHRSFFPGDLSVIFEKDGFRLGLVGLNSSWIQYAGDSLAGSFEGKLQIPREQFRAALSGTGCHSIC